jgi:hypothetical protein
MVQDIHLNELEKKTWTSIFQDGLSDIVIGMILVISTICQTFNTVRFYLYALYILPALFIIIGKYTITRPRLGLVRFRRHRSRRMKLLFVIMTLSIVFLLVLTIMGIFQTLPMSQVLVGSIILIICCTIAFFLNMYRMYLYGILMTLSFTLSEIMIHRTGVIASGAFAWLISGGIITAIGIAYLIRFLKKYPVRADGILINGGPDEKI